MSMDFRWDADGMARLAFELNDMLNPVARDIERDAKRYAPRGATGELKDGIEAMPAVNNVVLIRSSRNVAGDDPDVPIFVEYGTRNTPAQPYMRPAAYQKRTLRKGAG